MKLIPRTSIGIEVANQDMRIAVVREFASRRRLLRMDVLPGFAASSEEDKAASLAVYLKKHNLSGSKVHLTLPGACGVTRDL